MRYEVQTGCDFDNQYQLQCYHALYGKCYSINRRMQSDIPLLLKLEIVWSPLYTPPLVSYMH